MRLKDFKVIASYCLLKWWMRVRTQVPQSQSRTRCPLCWKSRSSWWQNPWDHWKVSYTGCSNKLRMKKNLKLVLDIFNQKKNRQIELWREIYTALEDRKIFFVFCNLKRDWLPCSYMELVGTPNKRKSVWKITLLINSSLKVRSWVRRWTSPSF